MPSHRELIRVKMTIRESVLFREITWLVEAFIAIILSERREVARLEAENKRLRKAVALLAGEL